LLGMQRVKIRMEPNFSSEDCTSGKQLLMNSWQKEWTLLRDSGMSNCVFSTTLSRPCLQAALLVVWLHYCTAIIFANDFLRMFQLNAFLMLDFLLMSKALKISLAH